MKDSLMPPIYKLVAARHGRFFVNSNDTYVGNSMQHYGEWSEPEIALFEQVVSPGDTVLEAGANMGSHTVWLSRHVGQEGAVYAFEPARHTFQLLCANLVANDCLNVTALQQALGAQEQDLDVTLLEPRQPWNFGGASMKKQWTTAYERVKATTVDDLERVGLISSRRTSKGSSSNCWPVPRAASRSIDLLSIWKSTQPKCVTAQSACWSNTATAAGTT